ncbi:50S ribosomal protein L13 [Candidatus Woesearchaeota archaeon]|nr:50S ribosomal protein L13 [Candidatus Woesearchaeota archaeon]
MIINANNLILGRLASFAAKQALLGEKIEIVNSEETVIIGSKKVIYAKYDEKIKKGNPHHGPFFPERPDRILKRTIKNMLPYKQYKGKRAFKNITCYLGIPENIKENNAITVESAKLKETAIKYIKLKELIRLLKQK